ncbi:MAG: hypothetical protein ACWA40_09625 [Planktomarina sp.]
MSDSAKKRLVDALALSVRTSMGNSNVGSLQEQISVSLAPGLMPLESPQKAMQENAALLRSRLELIQKAMQENAALLRSRLEPIQKAMQEFSRSMERVANINTIQLAAPSLIKPLQLSISPNLIEFIEWLNTPDGQAAIKKKERQVAGVMQYRALLREYPELEEVIIEDCINKGRVILPPPAKVKDWRDVAEACDVWTPRTRLKHRFIWEVLEMVVVDCMTAHAAANCVVQKYGYSVKGPSYKKGTVVGITWGAAVQNIYDPACIVLNYLEKNGFGPYK